MWKFNHLPRATDLCLWFSAERGLQELLMKLPVVKPKQLIRVLEKKDCIFKRQTGSHRIFYYSRMQRIIVVPIHSKNIKKGLLRSIIKELDMSIKDFVEFLKK